VELTPWPLSY